MDYKELTEILNSSAFEGTFLDVSEEYDAVLRNVKGEPLATISKTEVFCMSTDFKAFSDCGPELKQHIWSLAAELAETPYKYWRKEEEYYWRLDSNGILSQKSYLNVNIVNDYWFLDSHLESNITKTKFTESEYKTYQKTLDIHIPIIREKV